MESVQERYRYATPLKQGKSMGRLLFLGKCAHGFAPLGNREMHCGLANSRLSQNHAPAEELHNVRGQAERAVPLPGIGR